MTSSRSTEAVRDNIKNGSAWYIAKCKPNAELVAIQNLKNQNITTFLPLQKVTNRKAKAFQTPLRPLFPGYVFVKIDIAKNDWVKINNTRGVARLVGFNTFPSAVPPGVMESLFASCNKNNIFDPSATLKTGDKVQIIQGPLTGFLAKINNVSIDRRVCLLLEIMGQTSTIQIKKDHLAKVT